MKLYAGIGPRNTPQSVLAVMKLIAENLEVDGFTLRSGDAAGADRAFQSGTRKKEIFLAGHKWDAPKDAVVPEFSQEQYDFVAHHYGNYFHNHTPYVQKLFMRNLNILLGANLDTPVNFVLYWHSLRVPDGGTGHAIRMAKALEVPAFNLAFEDECNAAEAFALSL